jgi:hypothetical protein
VTISYKQLPRHRVLYKVLGYKQMGREKEKEKEKERLVPRIKRCLDI